MGMEASLPGRAGKGPKQQCAAQGSLGGVDHQAFLVLLAVTIKQRRGRAARSVETEAQDITYSWMGGWAGGATLERIRGTQ